MWIVQFRKRAKSDFNRFLQALFKSDNQTDCVGPAKTTKTFWGAQFWHRLGEHNLKIIYEDAGAGQTLVGDFWSATVSLNRLVIQFCNKFVLEVTQQINLPKS